MRNQSTIKVCLIMKEMKHYQNEFCKITLKFHASIFSLSVSLSSIKLCYTHVHFEQQVLKVKHCIYWLNSRQIGTSREKEKENDLDHLRRL